MLNDIHYELIWTCFRFGDDVGVLESHWWFCVSAWDKKGLEELILDILSFSDTHRSAWNHRSGMQTTEAVFQRAAQQCISAEFIIMHFYPKKTTTQKCHIQSGISF